MNPHIARDVRWLKIYAVFSTLAFCVVFAAAFAQKPTKTTFDEIDVERINIVEKDGALKLVISNKARAPDPVVNGKTFVGARSGGNSAGMIFYNADGDEVGGLVYGNQGKGASAAAGAAILFDQYKQDQTVGLMYSEEGGQRSAGLHVWDRPDIPLDQLIEERERLETEEERKAWRQRAREEG